MMWRQIVQRAGFMAIRPITPGKMASLERRVSQPIFRPTSFVGHTRFEIRATGMPLSEVGWGGLGIEGLLHSLIDGKVG
jgi:hypothetical protein